MATETKKGLALFSLLGFVVTGPASAWGGIDEVALPTSREERAAVMARRYARGDQFPSPGFKPAEAYQPALREVPGAPGPAFEAEAFARFLRNALKQSYNKPYREAYILLRTTIDNAYQVTTPPAGIDACLRGARAAGAVADRWDEAWEILHTTLQELSLDPAAFSDAEPAALRNVLGLARKAAWDKTYRNAFLALDHFLTSILARTDLLQDPVHAMAVGAARASGYRASEWHWDDAWRQQDRAVKLVAESDGSDPRADFYRAGLSGAVDSRAENAYHHLRIFAEAMVGYEGADPFDRVTLETSLTAAAHAKKWTVAYKLLRDAFRQLAG